MFAAWYSMMFAQTQIAVVFYALVEACILFISFLVAVHLTPATKTARPQQKVLSDDVSLWAPRFGACGGGGRWERKTTGREKGYQGIGMS